MYTNCIKMKTALWQVLQNGIFVFCEWPKKKFYHDFRARTIVFRDFERSASYCWWPSNCGVLAKAFLSCPIMERISALQRPFLVKKFTNLTYLLIAYFNVQVLISWFCSTRDYLSLSCVYFHIRNNYIEFRHASEYIM